MHSWFRHSNLSSLRIRLVLLVLLAVIPALGLILYTASAQRRSAASEAQENLFRITKFAAATERQASEGARQLLIALSQMPAIRQGKAEECNRLLADLLTQYQAYVGFGVLNATGYSICSAPDTAKPVYAGDRAYFRLARETRQFAMGEYQVGRVTGKSTLNFAYPILNESGQVRAIVVAALDLAWLDQLAAEVELPPGSVVTVSDRNGTILVRHPDSRNWVGKSVPHAPMTQRVLSQREGTAEAVSLDGVERLYAFTTLGDSFGNQDIRVRIGIPKTIAFAEADRLLVQNLTGLGLVTALALTAAWVGGDIFLTRKVRSLVETAQKLQSGFLNARTELPYESGELGQLARAFDEMAAAIEAREQAIAALNQDLQTLFEVIPIGVLIASDPEFKQVKPNPAFASILGLAPETNASYTPPDTPRPSYKILKGGRELTPDEFPLRYAAIHKTEIKGTEVDILRGDGTVFNLFGYAKPLLDEQGQVRGSVAAFLDITDRKQAEAFRLRLAEEREQLLHQLETSLGQLEGVINNMTEGLIIAEPGGNILIFNPAAIAMHGFTSLRQARRQLRELSTFIEVHDLQGNFVPMEQWPLSRALRGETFSDCEIQVHRRDIGKTWIGSYGGAPIRDKQGQVILAIVTLRDVTEQRQAQSELARSLAAEQVARAEAEAANRIKDEFLAVLSHELRSPLNPILGWSKLLQLGKLDEAQTKVALTTIERNAKLQSELIEDLLDVSRILQGKLSLNISAVNLATTIQSAMETVWLAAEAKAIHIEASLDWEVGQVSGDPARLQQVIWNLLSNAVKFTLAGGRVDISLERVNDQAQITVSDTGKGIAADFLPYMFDYFRQADATTTRKFGGLGLGLAIVRHIVELHGGTVAATSLGEGKGATFIVQLPLLKSEKSDGKPEGNLLNPPASPHPLAGIHILLVDDDTDTRDVIAFTLEQSGAIVAAAASVVEALQIFGQKKFDLLISDIGMPDADGYTLMRQIRALPAAAGGKILAIALTAYAGEFNRRQALAAGFQQHLAKPIEPDELIRAVLALLSGKLE
ncbi:response regulator [Phormidium tenue FACHB-886]|nr:response regulator [Phormidium tenue FACHB-886]